MNTLHSFCEKLLHQSKTVFSDEKKRVNLLLCAGLAGLMLLAFSTWIPSDSETKGVDSQSSSESLPQDYAEQLEQKLQDIIAQVEGVGAVRVMVTLQTGTENVYATDTQMTSEGLQTENHVILSDNGLVETTRTPQVLGVAVVCEGGANAAIQNRVSTLVEALTGVGANHITVAQMAQRE